MIHNYLLGIDLGGTNLKVALVNQRFQIIRKAVQNTQSYHRTRELVAGIRRIVEGLCAEAGIRRSQLKGAGVGLPGPVDAAQGLVHFFPNIKGWRNVRLGALLTEELRIPVFLDNDANLMCLAEYHLGAARKSRNAVCITLGTGVGGGVISEGRLYHGSGFAAGEVGHIPLNEAGPRCNCGGIACLEAYVGNQRLLGQAARVFGRTVSLEQVSALAHRGNRKAIAFWQQIGNRIGVMLAGVVDLLNPEVVVIGGGVANAGPVLLESIRATVKRRAMPVQARMVRVLKARLGNDAGLIGAALLASRKGQV